MTNITDENTCVRKRFQNFQIFSTDLAILGKQYMFRVFSKKNKTVFLEMNWTPHQKVAISRED